MKFPTFAICLTILLAVAANGKRCKSQEDCEADECCISRGLIGFLKGDCKKLANEGESCSDPDDTINVHGEKYTLFCPCVNGFSCVPSEVKDLPFIGTVKIDEKCIAETTAMPEVTNEESAE